MTVNVMVPVASLGILISTVTSSEEPSKDGMMIIESLLICMELDFSKTVNFIITGVVLLISTFIASIFQSISDYISLIGSFCTVIIFSYRKSS